MRPLLRFNRSVRLRHAGSVLLLAVAALGSYLLMVDAVQAEKGDAAEIDLAGRQRMLSQRVTLLAHRLSAPASGAERPPALSDLDDAVATLETSHRQLVEREGTRPSPVPAVGDALSAADEALVPMLAAVAAIQADLHRGEAVDPSKLHALDAATDHFLPVMHAAVGELTTAAEGRVQHARSRLFLVFLLTLGVLGIEVWFVFIPVQRQLEGQLHDLEQARVAADAGAQAKTDFLATMSHEIRTPLNGVVGLIDVLETTDHPTDRARILAAMRESSHALTEVLNDVLDFSKFDAQGVVLEAVSFDLHDLVRGVVRRQGARAANKGLPCVLDITPGVPRTIDSDPTRLRQILDNLLSNAVKFTTEGHVKLTVSADQTGLQLAVSDTGEGIDPTTSAHLFQAFTQAERSTSRRFGGTGLGLGIVSRLVQAFGGVVTVDGEPGVGSTFTVRLPIATAEAWPKPEVRPQRVWVVDAVDVRRAVWVEQVRALGHEVVDSASLADRPAGGRIEQVLVCLEDDPEGPERLQQRLQGKLPLVTDRFVVVAAVSRVFDSGSVVGRLRRLELHATPAELVEALHPAKAPPVQSTDALPRTLLAGQRVLVVDDAAVNRLVVGRMLELLGAEVRDAESAAEGRAQVADFSPHLIFMDHQMPEEDGLEATRELITRLGSEAPTVVGFTASTDARVHAECREAGMVTVLTKPISIASLQQGLTTVLSLQRMRRVG